MATRVSIRKYTTKFVGRIRRYADKRHHLQIRTRTTTSKGMIFEQRAGRSIPRRRTFTYVVWSVLTLGGLSNCQSEGGAGIEQRKATGFDARGMTLENTSFDLREDYAGEVVFLNVWASWCGPCKREMPSLRRIQHEYAPQGLKMLGINVDAPANRLRAQKTAQNLRLDFPNLHDPNSQIAAQFDASALPTSALLDHHGAMVWHHVGMLHHSDEKLHEAIRSALAAKQSETSQAQRTPR